MLPQLLVVVSLVATLFNVTLLAYAVDVLSTFVGCSSNFRSMSIRISFDNNFVSSDDGSILFNR